MKKVKLIKQVDKSTPDIPIGTIFYLRKENDKGAFVIPVDRLGSINKNREYFLFKDEFTFID